MPKSKKPSDEIESIGFQFAETIESPLGFKLIPENRAVRHDPLEGLCENLRARTPLPKEKRNGPSLFEGLPDIHDVFDL